MDVSGVAWRKSVHSAEETNCVEIAVIRHTGISEDLIPGDYCA